MSAGQAGAGPHTSSPSFHWQGGDRPGPQAASVRVDTSNIGSGDTGLRQPVGWAELSYFIVTLTSPHLRSGLECGGQWFQIRCHFVKHITTSPVNLVQSSQSPCWIVRLFGLIFMLCEYNAPSYWVYTCPKEGITWLAYTVPLMSWTIKQLVAWMWIIKVKYVCISHLIQAEITFIKTSH